MRSEFGKTLKIAVEGESHGEFVAGELSGFPAGVVIDKEKLEAFMARRRGGNSPFTTPRAEADIPIFEAGAKYLPNGNVQTTGDSVYFTVINGNKRSWDYSKFWDTPRPSHADYTARVRYGDSIDLRGGGHFSARLTTPLCVMGNMCMQLLEARGIRFGTHLASVGNVKDKRFDAVNCSESDFEAVRAAKFPTIDPSAAEGMIKELTAASEAGDSMGGIVECAITGVPAGLGDPLYDGVENRLAQAIFGLGGVRGIEFGTGFEATTMRGSKHNDPFVTDGKTIKTVTNHCGGIQAGITNGMPIIFRVAFKPTASISIEQDTVSMSKMSNEKLTISGRHDPCIAIRALPCVEAVAALVITDLILGMQKREKE
ncbi:MAG: chorismate synthase [Clostridia bacterium]|nr:chorismate synthase [Clostridia bacterium]